MVKSVVNMKDKAKITQRDINALPQGVHKIESNFYVRVRDNRRTYIFKATIEGKRREIGLGSAYEVSFAIARSKALKLKSQIASGEELFVDKLKEEAKGPIVITFDSIADEAIEVIKNRKRWRSEKHSEQWKRTVRVYASPVFGSKPIDDVTRDDVLRALKSIWETKTETASRLVSRLEKIFEYAIFKGVYTHPNPARWKGNLEMILPSPNKVKKVEHHAAPTIEELRRVAQKFSTSGYISNAACLFGILTACRVQEFLFARWDEVDLETKTFEVSPDRRKDGKDYPHRVPLSDQAISLLRSIERRGDLIFLTDRLKPMCIDTPRTILRKNVGRAVTMHGCRSTFRDWCAETGVDRVLAEKSLMHATGTEVEQAYQRADLLEQRRPIMQAWSDYIVPRK